MIEIRYIFDWEHQPVNEYTISNGRYQFSAMNIGAAITKIIVPNKQDKLENIVLRYFDYKDYKQNNYLLGTLVDYEKFMNQNRCQLNYYFECKLEQNTILFTYQNNHHYIEVKYSLLDNQLLIEYNTNMDLILSNVIYFNLTGNLKGDTKDHQLIIGNQSVNLRERIVYFNHYDVINEKELMFMKLKEKGIKVSLDSLERHISISNGDHFKQLFHINKEMKADLYSGVGIVVGGNKFNKFINYEFN